VANSEKTTVDEAVRRMIEQYLELLEKRVRSELEGRGIKVLDIGSSFYFEKERKVRYNLLIEVEIEVRMKASYEVLYDTCRKIVGERVAQGKVPKDMFDLEVKKCIDEKIRELDDEYLKPPYYFEFRSRLFDAQIATRSDNEGGCKVYRLVLSVTYSPLIFLRQSTTFDDMVRGLDEEASMVASFVEKMMRIAKELKEEAKASVERARKIVFRL